MDDVIPDYVFWVLGAVLLTLCVLVGATTAHAMMTRSPEPRRDRN